MLVMARNVPSRAPRNVVTEKRPNQDNSRKRKGRLLEIHRAVSLEYKEITSLLGSWNWKETETLSLFCLCCVHILYKAHEGLFQPLRPHDLSGYISAIIYIFPLVFQFKFSEKRIRMQFHLLIQGTSYTYLSGHLWQRLGGEGVVTQHYSFSSNHEYGRNTDLPKQNSCFNGSELERKLELFGVQLTFWSWCTIQNSHATSQGHDEK